MSIAELSQHSSLCEYIAGFIDGDGMINMPKPTREPWPKPRISISQSCNSGKPPELSPGLVSHKLAAKRFFTPYAENWTLETSKRMGKSGSQTCRQRNFSVGLRHI